MCNAESFPPVAPALGMIRVRRRENYYSTASFAVNIIAGAVQGRLLAAVAGRAFQKVAEIRCDNKIGKAVKSGHPPLVSSLEVERDVQLL